MDAQRESSQGTVVSVRGSVVDAQFPERLPEFYSELRAGDDGGIVVEVVSHVDPKPVRGVALNPTSGLARGSVIVDMRRPLQVPVGERMLSRVVNVFGQAIDGREAFEGGEWRPLHAPPVSLAEQGPTTESLLTATKVIGLLPPPERRGKGGRLGRAGLRKSVR